MHQSLPTLCRANGLLVFWHRSRANLDQPRGDMDGRGATDMGRQTRGDDETVERRAWLQLCRKWPTRLTALQAAENLALFEGYGLQAVHNCCVMNPALAAEGCYSSRNHPFRSLFSR